MNNKVSVALASYNGEKYIEKQIKSILANLKKDDELIISDDGSTDNTIKIINKYMKKDSRIKLINGPKKGIKQNFANAINNCKGEYIFLSDQDDEWMNNKVATVLDAFSKNDCLVVQHDVVVTDDDDKVILDSYFKFRKCGSGILKNIYKCRYLGCAMAFKRELKEKILPIPDDIDMHDLWVGILGDLFGKTLFINDKLINYKRHGDNNSDIFHHYKFSKMLKNRINLIKRILEVKLK